MSLITLTTDFGDADGVGTEALLEHPQGIAYANDLLYIADTYNHKIRTVDPVSLQVRTVVDEPDDASSGDSGAQVRLGEPGGLSATTDTLYIADTNNHAIRLLDLRTGILSTLPLSNLSVAVDNMDTGTLEVALPRQTVTPGDSTLRIRLVAPEGGHLSSLATSELTLSSSDAQILELGEESVSFSTDEPSVQLSVPMHLRDGDAVIRAEGLVYYCDETEPAICLIADLDISLPVTVTQGASQTEIILEYDLTGAP